MEYWGCVCNEGHIYGRWKNCCARVYEDYYLNKDQTSLSDEQFENAKVAVIVPDGADENSPIFYMVDNSGWL